MAAMAPVPQDFSRVKEKVIGNLTKRQAVCFGAAVVIGLPLYFLLRKTGNSSLAAMGMILVMLPLFFLAMYEKNGQPLEVVLAHFIRAVFVRPKTRPYRTDNYYARLARLDRAEKEVEEIVRISERNKKEHAAHA